MSTVFAFFSRANSNPCNLDHEPTQELRHRTLILIPKRPFDGPAIVSEIPATEPGASLAKCCRGQIVGTLDVGDINRADVRAVRHYLELLARQQGFAVTELVPRCKTCYVHFMFVACKVTEVADPVHVVAQRHIDFMGGVCCDGGSGGSRRQWWRSFLRPLRFLIPSPIMGR